MTKTLDELFTEYESSLKLNAFFAALDDVDEYLYAHSVCDVAQDAECTPDDIRAWLTANGYIQPAVRWAP